MVQQALGLLADPTTEPEQLQVTLARDPALALKGLRLANSAHYRRGREIATLSSSVVFLGFKSIQTLILSAAVHRVLATAGPLADRLWEHSFAVAVGCRQLGRPLGLGAADREEAFLAGLFHDVGRGVIAWKFPGVYTTALGSAGEIENLGFDHAHLGRVLLERWEIPGALAEAVGSHHGADPTPLGELVRAAEWVSWEFAPGLSPEGPEGARGLLDRAGMGMEGVTALRELAVTLLAEERDGHD